MNGARYLANALQQLGVSDVFFMDAVLRPTLVELEALGIGRVMAHAEKSVAYMADGYARVSGRVGVCLCQSVGAANLAAGLQDAYLHRSPIVAITGRREPMFRYRNAYQEVDHRQLFAAVTRQSMDVAETAELPHLLAQAFRLATHGSPRPVHLDFNGLGGEKIEAGVLDQPPLPHTGLGALPLHRPVAPGEAIEAAAARLRQAARPVIVAGTGAIQAAAHDAVRQFAESRHIPVATSLGGRGILPTTHPLHIGTVGTYSAPPGNQLLHQADLVVYIGCHTGDQVTCNYSVPAQATPQIQIDLDGSELGRNYPDVCGVWGCPRQATEDLSSAVTAKPDWKRWATEAGATVAHWRQQMEPHCQSNAQPIRVERLCREIANALPENAVLVADTGYSGIWTATLLDLPHKEQTYLRAAGSLGWSYPAALGAQLGAPDRPVVCFSGDGAFYYHLSEMETQRRRGIPVVTVINNNSGFGQGVYKVREVYGERPGSPEEINQFGPTNFAAIAKDFGINGIRVEDPGKLGDILKHAIKAREPALIDVVTDIYPRAPEAWLP